MALVDLAESYGVMKLKEKCDIFLINTQPTIETVFSIYESLKLYSLKDTCHKVSEYIMANASKVLRSNEFKNVKKETVLDIVAMQSLSINEEDLFKAVSSTPSHDLDIIQIVRWDARIYIC